MKCLILFMSVIIYVSKLFGQQTIKVIDTTSNLPVSYATVTITNKSIGLITSSDGIFRIKFEDNDSILITSAEYDAFLILGKNIKDTVRLKRKFVSLNPISIYAKPFTSLKLGNNRIKKGIWSWQASENHEFAQKIFIPPTPSRYKVKKVFIPVDKRTKCPSLLLLRLYLADTLKNVPGEEVLCKLIVSDDSLIRKGMLNVDISSSNLFFSSNDSFFVSITWPPGSLDNPCKTLLRLSKFSTSQTYYRASTLHSFQWVRRGKMRDLKNEDDFSMNCFFSVEADVYK